MFHFLIGLFIVAFIVMAMVASPGFRNFVLISAVVLGAGVWWLIDSSNRQSEKRQADQAAAERIAYSAIKATDLQLDDVQLKKATYGLADFTIEGTVANNSKSLLSSIFFEVTLTDCLNDNCKIVGQASTSASVAVPAGQVRSFSSYALKFENLPPVKGSRTWKYRIVSLRAA
ncbi:hypothetical protein BH10PSE11_BH10PSE11_08220 [soil metagenome]